MEGVLLDKDLVPLVSFTKDGEVIAQNARRASPRAGDIATRSQNVPRTNQSNGDEQNTGIDMDPSRCFHGCEKQSRKAMASGSGIAQGNAQDAEDLLQALPTRELFRRVVDYFCQSFHHWIPFLHKAKCQMEVQQIDLDPELAPVLHALVAVVLPRLAHKTVDFTHDQLHRQTRISRDLALQYAMTNANLQSLQALLILVFEQVSVVS